MRIITILLILNSQLLLARNITLTEIVNNALKNDPALQAQRFKQQMQKAKIIEATGAFDISLKSEVSDYLEGKYDSDFSNLYLDKSISALNSKISIGARKNNGPLPVYLEEFSTNEDTELFMKFKLSLLQFRDIDPKRYKVFEAKNKNAIEKINLSLKELDTKVKILVLYQKWLLLTKQDAIYQNLVKLNKNRLMAIKARVRQKDLAKIYEAEANQYLIDSENKLLEIQIKKTQTINKLQYFDSNLGKNDNPVLVYINNESAKNIESISSASILIKRPEVQMIDKALELADQELSLSENYSDPKLDFSMISYNSQIIDAGDRNETRAMLNLSIPIENKLGRGKVSGSKNKIKRLKALKDQISRNLNIEIKNIKTQILGSIELIENYRLQVALTKKLQEAEWTRFKSGASDFFLINTRDANYAKAELDYYEAKLRLDESQYILNLWQTL